MAGEDQKQEMEDELWDQCIKLRLRAEAAEQQRDTLLEENRRLRDENTELRDRIAIALL